MWWFYRERVINAWISLLIHGNEVTDWNVSEGTVTAGTHVQSDLLSRLRKGERGWGGAPGTCGRSSRWKEPWELGMSAPLPQMGRKHSVQSDGTDWNAIPLKCECHQMYRETIWTAGRKKKESCPPRLSPPLTSIQFKSGTRKVVTFTNTSLWSLNQGGRWEDVWGIWGVLLSRACL
jgi:hypothetical protein